MRQTESRYFLDSSAWLSYFFAENEELKGIIDSGSVLFTSVISLFEIKRKLIKEKIDMNKIHSILSYIKEKSIIVRIEQDVCEKAAEISIKEKLHTTDSLIYTSSVFNNCIFVTGDQDFKNIKEVLLIK